MSRELTPRRPRLRSRAEPRLVLRFVVLTAAGLLTAGVAILVIVNHAFAREAQRQANDHARSTVALALGDELRPTDFRVGLGPERRSQLRRLMSGDALGSATVSATLYSTNGGITFTSAPRTAAGAPGEVSRALTGQLVSHVASLATGRVVSTFVPIQSGDGRTIGVFRLDRDYGPIEAAARRSSLVVAAILEALLLVLCALLLPVLARSAARLRRHVAELDHIATHDELTGLPNRLGFERALDAATGGSGGEAALLLFDVDGFHEINNTLGASSGDRLLVEVAERLQANSGEAWVGRLGEDEFGILLPTREPLRVTALARELQAAFARPLTVAGVRLAIEPRIGAALIPDHGPGRDQIVRRAGVALAAAKERQVALEIFDPSHDTAERSRAELTAELRDALSARQLVVHYQPQADLTTRAIRGIEALVRWEHPRHGTLAPDAFIPLAERTGLITEIDRYVLRQAMADWEVLHGQGVVVDLAVNLSPVDLLDAELADQLEDLFRRHNFPAEHLVLEITERTLVRDERGTHEGLNRLSATGARLSIDDFGTGYSSLAYLYKLPFRQVKLDRTFVANMPDDPSSDAIVSATVELAHAFNATVVAEGVETAAQWAHLETLRCDIAQGFFIGRPEPAADVIELLTRHPGKPVLVAA